MVPNDYYVAVMGELGNKDVQFPTDLVYTSLDYVYKFLVPSLNLNLKTTTLNAPNIPYTNLRTSITDFFGLKFLYDASTNRDIPILPFAQLEAYSPNWENVHGDPVVCCILGEHTLCITPVKEGVVTQELTMVYSAYPKTFKEETTIIIPDYAKDLLIFGALAILFAESFQFQTALYWLQEFIDKLGELEPKLKRIDNYDTYRMMANV